MAATWTTRPTATSSNRRALLIALVFGLLSAFLIYRVLTATQSKGGTVAGSPVVVARQDIPARTQLTADMLTVKTVPDSLHLTGVVADPKALVGKYTKQAILAGEQIPTTVVSANPAELGFSGQVPQGMRAISINVTEVSVAGGLIQPGDAVDVIGIFQVPGGQNQAVLASPDSEGGKNLMTMTILQDVQVLAVGQAGIDNSTTSKVSPTKGQPDVKTVTLAVSPEDAERLALGQQTGILQLALRRAGDHQVGPVQALPNLPSTFQGGEAGAPAPPAQSTPGGR
jgi:pilus assembly protein CpaB